MQPISATMSAALRRSHTRVSRLSVLDSMLNPVSGGIVDELASGQVVMSRRRDVQRTCQLMIANPGGILTPRLSGDLFYWDRLLRIERGVQLTESQAEYATLGTFLIDSPQLDVGPGSSTLGIAGADQMDRLLRSKFTAPTTYALGATLASVILDLATDAGANANHLSLDDGGKTLGAAKTYEIGDERIAAMRELTTAYSLEFAANAMGQLVLRPVRDPMTLAPVWRFEAGSEATMLGITKRFTRDRLYNHILVTGEAADLTPIYAEAMDDDPASPSYINGPLGDRLYRYTSAMIRTVPQAQAVANALLYEHALIEESIELPHVANPALEVGDAIEIIEPISGTADRYIIDQLTIPVAAGSSRLSVRKLRSLL